MIEKGLKFLTREFCGEVYGGDYMSGEVFTVL